MKDKTKFIKFFFILFLILIVIVISKDIMIDFFNNISNSFNRTVIVEKRYILFFKGLKSTLLISFLSIIFGTLLGFILFLLQKSKIKILSVFSYMIVRFLQGVPVTVLLLTFYFGIFGNINIESILGTNDILYGFKYVINSKYINIFLIPIVIFIFSPSFV